METAHCRSLVPQVVVQGVVILLEGGSDGLADRLNWQIQGHVCKDILKAGQSVCPAHVTSQTPLSTLPNTCQWGRHLLVTRNSAK